MIRVMYGKPYLVTRSCSNLSSLCNNGGLYSGAFLKSSRFSTCITKELSHIDSSSNMPKMVDISKKSDTKRFAHARVSWDFT